jgi:hypothetical protein
LLAAGGGVGTKTDLVVTSCAASLADTGIPSIGSALVFDPRPSLFFNHDVDINQDVRIGRKI